MFIHYIHFPCAEEYKSNTIDEIHNKTTSTKVFRLMKMFDGDDAQYATYNVNDLIQRSVCQRMKEKDSTV